MNSLRPPVRRKILWHTLFWVALVSLSYWPVVDLPSQTVAWATGHTSLLAVWAYGHYYCLMPLLWTQRKTVRYGVAFIGLAALCALPLASLAQHSGLGNATYSGNLSQIFWTALFSAAWFALTDLVVKAPHQARRVANATSVEANLLKAQINPHFLFNMLNTIYGLTFTGIGKANDVIIKMTDCLRFVRESAEKENIQLTEEIEAIESLLEIERLRNARPMEVCFQVKGNTEVPLPPFLLLPFFENAAKHGLHSLNKEPFLHGYLDINAYTLTFFLENNMPLAKGGGRSPDDPLLTNVKQRLNLLYPQQHELLMDQDEERFVVKLFIQLRVPRQEKPVVEPSISKEPVWAFQ